MNMLGEVRYGLLARKLLAEAMVGSQSHRLAIA